MNTYYYALIPAAEYLDPASSASAFISRTHVVRSTGYQNNQRFFVLVEVPDGVTVPTAIMFGMFGWTWEPAPKGPLTTIQDVIPESEWAASSPDLRRGFSPLAQSIATQADKAQAVWEAAQAKAHDALNAQIDSAAKRAAATARKELEDVAPEIINRAKGEIKSGVSSALVPMFFGLAALGAFLALRRSK